ncbi:hypothetical protein BH23PLA1_BH23PLA1_08730 [soil metagenome]
MNLSELLPILRALLRSQKWQLIQLMVADLASEEGLMSVESGQTYPVWSPYHAFNRARPQALPNT